MFNQLGTYGTIDCPTKKIDEALNWLQEEFAKINGIVRKINNPHDFGSYPSFEVDYPDAIEIIDLDDDDIPDDDFNKKSDWNYKANKIQEKYSDKFEQWL